MAVTQYIGARYVPLFADPLEWSNTRTYEPLTIVQHEGNSYTSRQYVPVGIDISNEDYWALTGNYNAQIEQYRAEVQAYDQRITQAQNDATDATNAASTAQQTANAAQQSANAKAPINHASTEQTYGAGTADNYGHVKLTDALADTDASNGVAATPAMVYKVNQTQTEALASKAPTNHASAEQTYGIGTADNYGHVKLTDALADTDASNGVAATPAMVYEVDANLDKIIRAYRYQAIAATMRSEEWPLTNSSFFTMQSVYNNVAYINRAEGRLRIRTTGTVKSAMSNNDPFFTGLPPLATGTVGRGIMAGIITIPESGTPSYVNCTVEADGSVTCNASIAANTKCIFIVDVSTYSYYDDSTSPTAYAYALTTKETAQQAANHFKSYAGMFTYSNNVKTRLNKTAYASDCSGTIYLAYVDAGFAGFPTNASAIAGYGRIISYADKGEPLDLSNALPGDVICYDTKSDNNNLINHVAMVTGNDPIEVYEMGHADGSSGSTGPTIVTDPENYVTGRIRYVVRYW